ncbi:MAG: DNA repair protein RecN [Pseudomonadota bacterium]
MLASLNIKNVVLIDQLRIEFQSGLCALTGETGAGKSILLDSLGLALGARSDAGLVRKGTDQASVTAEFDIPVDHDVLAFLKKQDIEGDTNLILRRVVNSDGRSKAYLNDQPISVTLLKQIGEMLVEIHGQFDTQSLLNPRVHRGLLDDYGVKAKDTNAMSASWLAWKDKERAYLQAKEKMDQARADEEFLRQAVEDLDALSPKGAEEQTLTSLRERLMKREQYLEGMNTARAAVEDAEAAMGQGWRALERIGEDAKPMIEGMDRASAELQEVLAGIASFSTDLDQSEYSLQEIDDRLFALKAQARKHGCEIDALAEKREELAQALNLIESQDDVLDELMRTVQKAREAYIEKAKVVSKAREAAAKKLDSLVAKELPPLKMDKARFETSIETLDEQDWSARGVERVQFLVATNPNAEAGPINKIASGGEMARFMLALKVVLAEVGIAGSLVFDEVDSGIGGATADAVGERLAKLAKHRQILVVTHSPQVAARAGHHWIVAKDGKKDVRTNVIALPEDQERREEIARMLSGAEITEEARAAANKLLEGRAA